MAPDACRGAGGDLRRRREGTHTKRLNGGHTPDAGVVWRAAGGFLRSSSRGFLGMGRFQTRRGAARSQTPRGGGSRRIRVKASEGGGARAGS